MSELKRRHINEVMDMFCLTRGDMNWSQVYYADDADKVIAELEKDVEAWIGSFEASRRVNARTESKLRHSNYKRCLAMAMWCCDACDKWMMKKAKAIGLGKDGVKEYHQARRKLFHYMRWQTRWIKIAEKFKEEK